MRSSFSKLKVNEKKIAFVLYLLAFVFIFVRSALVLDPDFGWHLKTGELILKEGIPRKDPFSYTMPSFPVVAYAWLTEVLLASLFPLIGLLGVSFLFSLITFFTLFLVSGRKPLLTFISSCFILNFMASARPQSLGWLFFALLIFRFWDRPFWEKWKKLVPFLFLVWANLHGSFAAGLVVLLIRALFSFFKKKNLSDFYVFLFSFLATFVNPYGPGLWREVLSTITSSSLRTGIAEWQPFFLSSVNFLLLGFIVFLVFFTVRYRRKISLEEKVIVFFFFLQGLASVKLIPFWLIIALPLACKLFSLFERETLTLKIPLVKTRLKQIKEVATLGVLVIIFLEVFLFQIVLPFFSAPLTYPSQAVKFLKQDLPKGQIFSLYHWGGYLIWKLPEKKVFIDGRMAIWRTKKEIPGETKNAFSDYLDLLQGKIDVRSEFDKYGVETVLLPSRCPQDSIAVLIERFLKRLDLNLNPDSSTCLFLEKLEKIGWEKVYEDKVAVVYKKI